MAKKIIIDIWKKKDAEEFTKALADPESRVEAVSAAAYTAACASAAIKRAAELAKKARGENERLEYISRNAEILRTYMVHLIDEDVKSRAPLRKAMSEGIKVNIEAAYESAACIPTEIINMMQKLMELARETCDFCDTDSLHYVGEGACLAKAAADSCCVYVLDLAGKSDDETYRFVAKRENEITFDALTEFFNEVMGISKPMI